MTQHIDSIIQLYKMLTVRELVLLRHDAIKFNDEVSKKLIDGELKSRDKT